MFANIATLRSKYVLKLHFTIVVYYSIQSANRNWSDQLSFLLLYFCQKQLTMEKLSDILYSQSFVYLQVILSSLLRNFVFATDILAAKIMLHLMKWLQWPCQDVKLFDHFKFLLQLHTMKQMTFSAHFIIRKGNPLAGKISSGIFFIDHF